ncbi:hypothetical protein J4N45_09230 [Vibrio sp. SCSIO 43140]|uniref:hypothetical protein n=1 Tax=Vibrio sp. SCSIO 43140 TaxID=2819100 RepID=UPI0020753921|nr:hypothetical protein [Vibrio sp. SCSIO 43140]USD58713.1 hypothetical protein J4N45_09230 [Vibrio sp. SCSIO 43140]
MESETFFWLMFYASFLVATSIVGALKGRFIAGVLLGYVLGPIGLVVMLFSKDKRMLPCPHCGQKTHRHSYHCQVCHEKVYGCLN